MARFIHTNGNLFQLVLKNLFYFMYVKVLYVRVLN